MIKGTKLPGGVLIAIPARGGSKRLPRKNLLPLAGKPMLAYSIEASLASGLTDMVYVCTEDNEIASVAEQYGAKIFMISNDMAGDLVSSTEPCLALYDSLASQGRRVDHIFTLQPSSPLRTADDIKASYDRFLQRQAQFLVSVTPIDPHYFHWAFHRRQDGWEMFFGDTYMKERPLLPEIMRPNGAIKLADASMLSKTRNFLFHEYAIEVYEMPDERSIHVATRFDMKCAAAMLQDD